MSLQSTADDDSHPRVNAAAPDFQVVAGRPSSAELAAVTAVVSSLIDEIEDGRIAAGPVVSAWPRSQRSIRLPLTPGAGSWRSFSG